MYPHFGRVYSEITSSHLEIISFIYIYIYLQLKKPKKMKWDENETLHWIMRWGWMRWKWNLAFNNDYGKKTVQKTIYIKKINKKFNYYYYLPLPCFLFLFFALWK